MQSEQPTQDIKNEERALYFLPFDVQLQNIFTIEIVAKRFPVDFPSFPISPNVGLNVSEIHVDEEKLQAQVILDMHVEFAEEPRPFEISFRLLGSFTYTKEYNTEALHLFLNQGSLSIILPFARELLTSLCIRLQIPPLLLPLIQLTPPPENQFK